MNAVPMCFCPKIHPNKHGLLCFLLWIQAAIGQTEDKVLVPHWSNILCLHHCHKLPGIVDDLFAYLSLLPKDQSYNVCAISQDGRWFHPSGLPGIPVELGLPCI